MIGFGTIGCLKHTGKTYIDLPLRFLASNSWQKSPQPQRQNTRARMQQDKHEMDVQSSPSGLISKRFLHSGVTTVPALAFRGAGSAGDDTGVEAGLVGERESEEAGLNLFQKLA